MKQKSLTGNQLKMIAIISMTVDHLASVLYPDYPTAWWIVALHIIGRLAAPIFWYFIAEGYYYTHDVKRYALRLFAFAILSHFAYNFAFGIPFIPFQTSVFNQTSVIWSLAWGLTALAIEQSGRFKPWQKTVLILGITVITFCADWSSIAVLAIVQIGTNRGNFKKQMTMMMLWVAVYAVVYAVFIHPVYGVLQLFVALAIPLLKRYNGRQGTWKGMKWFFYGYYPLHLVLCGLLRLALYGNVGVMIGG
ncbi:conjugal transfer protein TraX [Anaerofilum sp. BX8]|uniref:Conjugal transfer protein TraX n=1 Tax=Anaerofilum hominis TaxID=2763016 RepID=A0A923L1C1_9FIRM|nr:TraX family protein [Anaerofilum hominis]MBC5581018.1 conjugal transfer protein TraX [Anaerofilum hominis]